MLIKKKFRLGLKKINYLQYSQILSIQITKSVHGPKIPLQQIANNSS